MVEHRILPLESFGKIDREAARVRKVAERFLLMPLWKFRLKQFIGCVGVAMDREGNPSPAVIGIGIVIKLPPIARAVIADRRRAEVAGNERSNECAAAFFLACD